MLFVIGWVRKLHLLAWTEWKYLFKWLVLREILHRHSLFKIATNYACASLSHLSIWWRVSEHSIREVLHSWWIHLSRTSTCGKKGDIVQITGNMVGFGNGQYNSVVSLEWIGKSKNLRTVEDDWYITIRTEHISVYNWREQNVAQMTAGVRQADLDRNLFLGSVFSNCRVVLQ